jgi:hypothetical protein
MSEPLKGVTEPRTFTRDELNRAHPPFRRPYRGLGIWAFNPELRCVALRALVRPRLRRSNGCPMRSPCCSRVSRLVFRQQDDLYPIIHARRR